MFVLHMDQIEVKVRAINEKSQRLHQNINITVKKCDLKYISFGQMDFQTENCQSSLNHNFKYSKERLTQQCNSTKIKYFREEKHCAVSQCWYF